MPPTVSVIIPSYNHAPYILRTLQSVLAQDFTDYELLIEDDASTDTTAEVLSHVSDPRISHRINTENKGAGWVTENLIRRAKGKYIALINSDDTWTPQKLSLQVAYLEANPDVAACFTRVRFIDAQDMPLDENVTYANTFNAPNRSSGQWLRHFLYQGNCLCNPSVLIRSDIFTHLTPYKNSLRQLPDLELWVRLLHKAKIHILDDRLVNLRLLPEGQNASSEAGGNSARILLEYMLVFENYFEGLGAERLIEGFGDLMRYNPPPTEAHERIEKAFLYLQPSLPGLKPVLGLIAYKKLYTLLNDPLCRSVLENDYSFTAHHLHRMEEYGRIFLPSHTHYPRLYRIAAGIYRRLFPRK